MADLSDVQSALVNFAMQAIYPNGITQPSIANCDVMLYVGWPVKAQLDNDLLANKAHVSVFSPTGMERNTTRFSTAWQDAVIAEPTLTFTVNDNLVVVGGVVNIPQTCVVIVNNVGYGYAVQSDDTLESIAANAAAIIPSAYAEGTTIVIPDAYQLSTNISVPGTAIRELKRQERLFQITVWTSSPTTRDVLVSALDVFFAAITRFILPDDAYARLKYHDSFLTDSLEKSRLYQRALRYRVEYATTQTASNALIAHSYLNSLTIEQTGTADFST